MYFGDFHTFLASILKAVAWLANKETLLYMSQSEFD